MSKSSIVNKALILIGANTITSLADGTVEANLASKMWNDSLKSVLSEAAWKFALKKSMLNKLAQKPDYIEYGMENIFQLPADWIFTYEVKNPGAKWEEIGDTIVANVEEFGIKYVSFINDTSKFPVWFIDAFAAKLAADMAFDLTNSNTIAQNMLSLYKSELLPHAKTKNARNRSTQKALVNEWTNSIYGGRSFA